MCLERELDRQIQRERERGRESQCCVKNLFLHYNGTLGSCMSLHNRPQFSSKVCKFQFILPVVLHVACFWCLFWAFLTGLASRQGRHVVASLRLSSERPPGINASVITQLCMIALFCHALCVIAYDIHTCVSWWGSGGGRRQAWVYHITKSILTRLS